MKTKDAIKKMILASLFAALTAVGAFLKIPVPPSAITLQTFFSALAGIILGAKWGAASQLIYVLAGLIGLPIFTAGGGIGYLLQPTCGFLIALPVVAAITGIISDKGKSPVRTALAVIAGYAALYLIGLVYMGVILNVYLNKSMNVWQICWAGMIPFLPGDALKVLVSSLLTKLLSKRLKI